MKKLLALFLACTMVLGLASCKEQDEEEKNTLTTEETVATMQDPIDALARCMVENNLEYNPEDPNFFWTALYYFAGGYGLKHEGVEELTDTYQLKVPSTVMEEYAIALFSDYKGLPELPEIMQGNVSYDENADAYLLSEGDIGLSETKLGDIKETKDGYTLVAELTGTDEEEELIASFDVTLIRNTFADEIENPLYLCSVSSMKMTQKEGADVSEGGTATLIPDETITATFNGLSDAHTAEMTLSEGDIRAFQFDAESAAGKIISGLNEGDVVTFGYIVDKRNGSYVIVSAEKGIYDESGAYDPKNKKYHIHKRECGIFLFHPAIFFCNFFCDKNAIHCRGDNAACIACALTGRINALLAKAHACFIAQNTNRGGTAAFHRRQNRIHAVKALELSAHGRQSFPQGFCHEGRKNLIQTAFPHGRTIGCCDLCGFDFSLAQKAADRLHRCGIAAAACQKCLFLQFPLEKHPCQRVIAPEILRENLHQ